MASPGPPVVRGWCPGVFDPLLTGDGWLVRIRCPGGVVTAAGLRLVAELAAMHGSGHVDLTSRANLQLRGLREATLEEAARELVAAGLAAADAASDGWRAIVTSPLAGHDPDAPVDTAPLVAALADRLVAEVDVAPPTKFGIVLDDGGSWPLDGLDADLRLGPIGGGRWSVSLRDEGRAGTAADPVTVALATARLCAGEGRRIDAVIEARGLPSVRAALGITPANGEPGARPPARAATKDDRPGPRRHAEPDRCSLVVAPFLGRLDATTVCALATVAEQDARAVRLTTARSVALCGIPQGRLDAIRGELAALGLLTTATDPRARISACVGRRGCDAARADTWAEAERQAGAGSGRVHLSGCEKACGAPRGVRHLVATDDGRFVEHAVPV